MICTCSSSLEAICHTSSYGMRILPMKYRTGFVNCFLKEEMKFISNTFKSQTNMQGSTCCKTKSDRRPLCISHWWLRTQEFEAAFSTSRRSRRTEGPGAAITTPRDFLSSVFLELKVRIFPGWDFSAVAG